MTVTLAPAAAPVAVALPGRVQAALDQFLDRQVPVLATVGVEVAPLLRAATDLLGSGKRLRPAFCYWGWRGAGGPDDGDVVGAAAALELLQAWALVHDDVMDRSDTRRGQPSAHRRFAAEHRAEGRLGSADDFGTAAAILLGDLLLAWSDEMLLTSGLPVPALLRAKRVLDVTRTELVAGQFLELLVQGRPHASATDVGRVVRAKSARYTVERPLHLGAALAGAGPEVVDAYSRFGLPLGEAFQLRDDLLGVFGDPARTGKPAGDDLREGKRTLLVVTALSRASGPRARLLLRGLGDRALSDDRLDALRQVIEDTGARAHVEARVEQLAGEALDALRTGPVDDAAHDALADLALAATVRDA